MARGTALVIGLATALLVLVSPAQAAAPNYILVSGPGLARPVLLANGNENLSLLLALVDSPRATGASARGLARRPRLDLAEFWGWSGKPRPTRASQANQHGQFYPEHRSRPAIIVVMVDGIDVPRLVPAKVLRILAAHGIPLRLQR